MTSEFMRNVHVKTAQQYKAQGFSLDYVLAHFHKVGIPEDEIPELLPLVGFVVEIDPTSLAGRTN